MVLLEDLCDDVTGKMVWVFEERPPCGSFQIFVEEPSFKDQVIQGDLLHLFLPPCL